jgi:hypothetical protein
LQGANEVVTILATPRTVTTTVTAGAKNDAVNLLANSGPVSITGDTFTTAVVVGSDERSKAIASGINANVSVADAFSLTIADEGNTTTPENATVTEKTVQGNLFGSPLVQVNYSNVAFLGIHSGALATGPGESWTIEGSSPSATIGSQIDMNNIAPAGLNVQANLTASSGLVLIVQNGFGGTVGAANLHVDAPGATFHLSQSSPGGSGQDTATFGPTSPSSNIQFQADGGPVNVFNSNI